MLRTSLALATAAALVSASPALAAGHDSAHKSKKPARIDVNTLPTVALAPHGITYLTENEIHYADGRVAALPKDPNNPSLSRYPLYATGNELTFAGRSATYETLDAQGNLIGRGGSHNIYRDLVGGRFALSVDYVVVAGGPKAIRMTDLSTGAEYERQEKSKAGINLLHVGDDGATFSEKARGGYAIRWFHADGSLSRLAKVKGTREPVYANPARNLIIRQGKGGVSSSSAKKPNTVRWSAPHQRLAGVSADTSRVTLFSNQGKYPHRVKLEVRKAKSGKVLRRFHFTTSADSPTFESDDSLLLFLQDRPGEETDSSQYIPVRCRVSTGACERLQAPTPYVRPADPLEPR